jgi:hypothetical protein
MHNEARYEVLVYCYSLLLLVLLLLSSPLWSASSLSAFGTVDACVRVCDCLSRIGTPELSTTTRQPFWTVGLSIRPTTTTTTAAACENQPTNQSINQLTERTTHTSGDEGLSVTLLYWIFVAQAVVQHARHHDFASGM